MPPNATGGDASCANGGHLVHLPPLLAANAPCQKRPVTPSLRRSNFSQALSRKCRRLRIDGERRVVVARRWTERVSAMSTNPWRCAARYGLCALSVLMMLAFAVVVTAQSVDPGFNPDSNWAGSDCCVKRILPAPGGGHYLVGKYTLRKVASNGVRDVTFDVGASGRIHDAVVQSSGKIVMVGEFNEVGGVHRPGIARINPDGTLDTSFNAGLESAIGAYEARVFQLASGKLLVSSGSGGGFQISPSDQRTLLLMSANGGIDNGLQLDSQLTNQAEAAPLPDGRILWFGSKWDDVQHSGSSDWVGVLSANGGIQQPLDDLLTIGLDPLGGLSVKPDGSVLVLGLVPTALPPSVFNFFGKLAPALGIDFGFQPDQLRSYTSSAARSLDSVLDGRVLFIGHYRWNGENFDQGSDRLGRVLANGVRDTVWVEPVFNNQATAMLLQADGSVVVAGEFTTVNGVGRSGLARILPEAPVDPVFQNGFE
ncbi:MAG TPA: delta-60 repeat domain-containing protein [Rhodanobacteraceae bacterium]|nr:delta-60 repeat domain-containing protein [Rhodanobacteraceae bacterium]